MQQTDSATGTATTLDPQIANLPAVIETESTRELVDTSGWDQSILNGIEQQAQAFAVMDSNNVLSFAAEPQEAMSAYLDTLIEGISTRQAGVAGDLAVQLAHGIDMMKLRDVQDQLKGGVGWASKVVRSLGLAKDYIEAFYQRQKAIKAHFDKMKRTADDRSAALTRESKTLDELRDRSFVQIRQLEQWIVLGERIMILNRDRYAKEVAEVKGTNDIPRASQLRELGRQIHAMDTRLSRIKHAYVEAGSLTTERINMIREAIKIEIQAISDGILFEIPKLKIAIVQVAALHQVAEAQEERQQMDDVSRQLDDLLDDSLEQTYTTAKESQGDSLDRVQRVQTSIEKMLAVADKAIEMEHENVKRRAEGNQLLIKIKEDTLQELQRDVFEGLATV